MKKLAAKVGTYQKDGQTKGRYVDIGVILANDSGEYVLLDPSVNLAGVLAKQNFLAAKEGKQPRESVAASIFEQNSAQNQNQGGFAQPQQGFNQPQQGFNQANAPQAPQVPNNTFGDDPFLD